VRRKARAEEIRAAIVCGLFLVASVSLGQASGPRSIGDEINMFRWKEDYSFLRDRYETLTPPENLKFLPLNESKTTYLTLGGEVRERMESYDDPFFGLPPGGANFTSFATRLLFDADLHIGMRFRAFAELGSFWESGRKPVSRPVDVGDLELQQGFFDVIAVEGAGHRLTVRFGRQEFPLGSGRLVAIRESTNVRLTFDAAKVEWLEGPNTVVAFAGRPVVPKKGIFESAPSGDESFWALDWTRLGTGGRRPNTEVFYLGRDLKTAVFAEGAGKELRHSIGGRVWAVVVPWDYSVQASYQFGTFADGPIHAWGVATDTGYRLTALATAPRIAVRLDVASGDRMARDRTLETFEAPYPALNYFSEASIFTPGNSYDVHPYVGLNLARTVAAEVGITFLWRLREGDAIYRAGGGILVPAGASESSSLTGIFQVMLTWRPNPFLTIQGAYDHASAGPVVRDVGGKPTNFGLVSLDLRL
jgi:hypothetical protein